MIRPTAEQILTALTSAPVSKGFADRIGHSPDAWLNTSDTLWQAALAVQDSADLAHKLAAAEHTGNRLARWWARLKLRRTGALSWTLAHRTARAQSHRVAVMLRSMSIEAALKAGYYVKQLQLLGHVSAIETNLSHNLPNLAKQIGLTLTPDETHHLQRLHIMIQLGRYPVAHQPRDKATGQPPQYYVNHASLPGIEQALRAKVYAHSQSLNASYKAAQPALQSTKPNHDAVHPRETDFR